MFVNARIAGANVVNVFKALGLKLSNCSPKAASISTLPTLIDGACSCLLLSGLAVEVRLPRGILEVCLSQPRGPMRQFLGDGA